MTAAGAGAADAPQSAPRGRRERVREHGVLYALARSAALYAVVDAAGKPDVYAALTTMGDASRCLYAGPAGLQYAGVAPWLVHLDVPRLDWVGAALAADAAWGLFVVASAPAPAVARQLRRLLTVRLPEGDLVRFRFYDPRVFDPFLGACTASELDFVFGPVDAYMTVAPLTHEVRVWDRPWRPALLPRPSFAGRMPPPPAPVISSVAVEPPVAEPLARGEG